MFKRMDVVSLMDTQPLNPKKLRNRTAGNSQAVWCPMNIALPNMYFDHSYESSTPRAT